MPGATHPACAPLAEGIRRSDSGSEVVETLHLGAICVKSGTGEELARVGDPTLALPLRSTAKPFQLLPYLLDGHHRAGVLSGRLDSLAVMMSSHSGEAMHTRTVEALLHEHGLSIEHLRCGVHLPFHAPTQRELLSAGREPSALHCNCSGKHASMLIVSKHRGWPLGSYLDRSHPLQERIAELVRDLAGLRATPSHVVDGCSLPSWVTGLGELCSLYARLALPEAAPPAEGSPVGEALALCFAAAVRHPLMIAGSGRLDSELMAAYQGRLLAKTGADGVYTLALRPEGRYPEGLAVAVKIADGDSSSRIRAVVTAEVLRQLGVLPRPPGELRRMAPTEIQSFRGVSVGEIRPVFTL